MTIELDTDRIMLRDEARRVLGEHARSERMRHAAERLDGFDAALWAMVGGTLGWCGVAVPEAAGGLGLAPIDMVLLAEETGRRLAPVPFWSSACLSAPLLSAAATDGADALLARIAGGAAATVALPRPDALDALAGDAVRAAEQPTGWRLDGTVSPVFNLPEAEIVMVPARLETDQPALFALERDAGHRIERLDGIDLTRPTGLLHLDGIHVGPDGLVARGAEFEVGATRAMLAARLAIAAEQVGAADGALDLTLAYVAERVQFGRPIASFQAIKHRCAALLVAIAEARSLCHGAAASLESGAAEAELEAAAAGALATDLLFRAAEEAIQLHGGVGNAWDYDPHYYLRRAQATAFMLGGVEDRLARIADALMGEAAR